MATPPFNPDEAKPASSDLVSAYPSAEQSFRDIIESWILIDHDRNGNHDKVTLADKSGSTPSGASGVATMWNDNGTLKMRDGTGTIFDLLTPDNAGGLLASSGVENTDWDNITETGFYTNSNTADSETSGGPPGTTYTNVALLHIQGGGAGTAAQILFRTNNSLSNAWFRQKGGGTWGDWVEVTYVTASQTLENKTLGSGTSVALGGDAKGDLWYRTSGGAIARRPIGSEGQVLTVNAGGLPAWQAPADNGMVLLDTQFLGGAGNATFKSTTGIDSSLYDSYVIYVTNMAPNTDNVDLWMRTSSDDGSSFDTGGSDYAYRVSGAVMGGANSNASSSGDSKLLMNTTASMGNAAGEHGFSGVIHIILPHRTLGFTAFTWQGCYFNTAGNPVAVDGAAGYRLAQEDTNAFRLTLSSGTFSGGKAVLYGLTTS